MSQAAAVPGPGEPLEWLLVEAGELQWLVPSKDLLYLGPLEPDSGPEGSCGSLHYHEAAYPAVYWDSALHLKPQAHEDCGSAVLLQARAGRLALACHRLVRLKQPPTFYALPACMQGRRQPFVEIAVLKDRALGRFDDQRLAAVLPRTLWQATDAATHTGTAS